MANFDWKKEYKKACSSHAIPRPCPLIGITGNFGEKGCELAEGYYQSVRYAGGIPVVIPPNLLTCDTDGLLEDLDALIFSGGGDINPLLLDEEPQPELHHICAERDLHELFLLRCALDRQLPILAICRGIQVLAAVTGGKLIQDLGSDPQFSGKLLKHNQDLNRCFPSHKVKLAEGSLLKKIFDTDFLAVNSLHHQAVKSCGENMRVVAQSSDGVIEAIESTEYKSIIGVQWHPEPFILKGDETMIPLFKWLINEANEFHCARELHKKILTLDTHCDTPMFFDKDICFAERDPLILVDAHKMREGHLDSCIMAAYLEQKKRDDNGLLTATATCNHLLDSIEQRIGACEGVDMAVAPEDLYRLKKQGKLAIMRGIENGYAIGKDIKNVELFRRRGVVYMTLCHNGDNDICDSAMKTNHEHNGLSSFGVEVIAEMNRVGMMVDLSHASEKTFYDALEVSKTPIVCSHASTRALCDHPRNLTDDQLHALAKIDGVMQVTLYPGFLCLNNKACIEDAVIHLKHAVDVAGIDCVGIGTDFDGDGGVPGMADASEVINFTRRLLREKFSEEDIEKIWGGNFLRVMRQVQTVGSIK